MTYKNFSHFALFLSLSFPTPRSKSRIQSSRTEETSLTGVLPQTTIMLWGKSPDILLSRLRTGLSGNAETRRHRSKIIAAYAFPPPPTFLSDRDPLGGLWETMGLEDGVRVEVVGCFSSCLDSHAIAQFRTD